MNVAGRSRGCSTCLRRRVKCGKALCLQRSRKSELNSLQEENRLICSRCIRCGFGCNGPNGTTFAEGKFLKSRRTSNRIAVSTRGTLGMWTLGMWTRLLVNYLSAPLKGIDFEIYICYTRKPIRGGLVDLALQNVRLSDILTARTSNGQIFYQTVLSFAIIYFRHIVRTSLYYRLGVCHIFSGTETTKSGTIRVRNAIHVTKSFCRLSGVIGVLRAHWSKALFKTYDWTGETT